VVLGWAAHLGALGWQQWGQLGPLRIGQFSLCSCHARELYRVVPSTLQTRTRLTGWT
jgi:hypothetical protein